MSKFVSCHQVNHTRVNTSCTLRRMHCNESDNRPKPLLPVWPTKKISPHFGLYARNCHRQRGQHGIYAGERWGRRGLYLGMPSAHPEPAFQGFLFSPSHLSVPIVFRTCCKTRKERLSLATSWKCSPSSGTSIQGALFFDKDFHFFRGGGT